MIKLISRFTFAIFLGTLAYTYATEDPQTSVAPFKPKITEADTIKKMKPRDLEISINQKIIDNFKKLIAEKKLFEAIMQVFTLSAYQPISGKESRTFWSILQEENLSVREPRLFYILYHLDDEDRKKMIAATKAQVLVSKDQIKSNSEFLDNTLIISVNHDNPQTYFQEQWKKFKSLTGTSGANKLRTAAKKVASELLLKRDKQLDTQNKNNVTNTPRKRARKSDPEVSRPKKKQRTTSKSQSEAVFLPYSLKWKSINLPSRRSAPKTSSESLWITTIPAELKGKKHLELAPELIEKIRPINPFQPLDTTFSDIQEILPVLESLNIVGQIQSFIYYLSKTPIKKERTNLWNGASYINRQLLNKPSNGTIATLPPATFEKLKDYINKYDENFFEGLFNTIKTLKNQSLICEAIKNAKNIALAAEKSVNPKEDVMADGENSTSETQDNQEEEIEEAEDNADEDNTASSDSPSEAMPSQIPTVTTTTTANDANPSKLPSDIAHNFFLEHPYLNPTMLILKLHNVHPDATIPMKQIADFYTKNQLIADAIAGTLQWDQIFQYSFRNLPQEKIQAVIMNIVLDKDYISVYGEELHQLYQNLYTSVAAGLPKDDAYTIIAKDPLDLETLNSQAQQKGISSTTLPEPTPIGPTTVQPLAQNGQASELVKAISDFFSQYPYYSHNPSLFSTKVGKACCVDDIEDFLLPCLTAVNPYEFWFKSKTSDAERKGMILNFLKDRGNLGVSNVTLLNIHGSILDAVKQHSPNQQFLIKALENSMEIQQWKIF